jgi:hypothetical protein
MDARRQQVSGTGLQGGIIGSSSTSASSTIGGQGSRPPESFASLGTRLEIASSNYVMPGSFMSSGSTVTTPMT